MTSMRRCRRCFCRFVPGSLSLIMALLLCLSSSINILGGRVVGGGGVHAFGPSSCGHCGRSLVQSAAPAASRKRLPLQQRPAEALLLPPLGVSSLVEPDNITQSVQLPLPLLTPLEKGFLPGDFLLEDGLSYLEAEGAEEKPIPLRLSFDDASGNLLLIMDNDDADAASDKRGTTVILNGVTPSERWSTSRPATTTSTTKSRTQGGANIKNNAVDDNNDDSLFLHFHYNEQHLQSAGDDRTTGTWLHWLSLGDLVGCHRVLAVSRLTRYWMGPKVGSSAKDGVPFDTQFLLVEVHENGPYVLMLPLVDAGFRASLHYGGDDDNNDHNLSMVCAAESAAAAAGFTETGESSMRALYVATGDDPYALLQKGFRQVSDTQQTFRTLDQKQLPPSVEEFGWCTWDAFYSKVTPAGVVEGVKSLTGAGVPPQTIILDDGWQQVTPAPPSNDEEEANNTNQQLSSSAAATAEQSSVSDTLFGAFASGVATFYDRFVRTAPHGSCSNRIWRALAHTVLRPGLWKFYDSSTDFNRQLAGFEANHKFETGDSSSSEPSSLKDLVSVLKNHLGVQRVMCWHALHGYWRGVSEELGQQVGIEVENMFPRAGISLLRLEPQTAWDPVTLFGVGVVKRQKDMAKFYTHLHTPLVEAGVDGVKVDVQSGVSCAGVINGGANLAKRYTSAMEDSVSKRFRADNGASNVINCMCHSTENLYRYQTTAVARASEDFFPDRPETHTVHLINVAYNSLFLGEICLPDWDMFHSKHESAGLHAAARAIGGCPIYVSDAPGKHDAKLLRTLVLPDGSTLRAKLPGRPTRDCLFADVGSDGMSALKIWNQNKAGGGVVGAFHVQGVAWNYKTNENNVVQAAPPPIVTTVKPLDVESFRGLPGPFAAWGHRAETFHFLKDSESALNVQLKHREWEIYTIVPVEISSSNNIMWGAVGLANMLNSGGALLDIGKLKQDSSSRITTKFVSRGPGLFIAFTNRKPSEIRINNQKLEAFSHCEESCKLSFVLPNETNGEAHRITVVWD